MNLFKRITGLFEKKEIPQTKSFSLKELESWLEERLNSERKGEVEGGESIAGEIAEAREGVEEVLSEIEERKFPEDIEKRIYKPVKTAKPVFVKGMRDAIHRIEIKRPLDHDNLLLSHKSLALALKNIQKIQMGQGRHVAFLYREEMSKLGTELNSLIDVSNRLKAIIEEKERDIAALEDLSSDIGKVRDLVEKRSLSLAKQEDLKGRLDERKREKIAMEKELKAIEESDAFREFSSTKKSLVEIEEQKKKLKGSIFMQLHPLKRAFKKFERLVVSGGYDLDEGYLEYLRGYIDDPTRTFLSGGRGHLSLVSILKMVKGAIDGGALQLKPREEKKVLNRIEFLIMNLNYMERRFDKISEEEISLSEKLSSFEVDRKNARLKDRIKGIAEEIEQLSGECDAIIGDITETEGAMKKLMVKIETKTSDIMEQTIRIRKSSPYYGENY